MTRGDQAAAPRECWKRRYESRQQAKKANAKTGWRLRVYWCQECHAFHSTNAEKG